VAGLAEIESPPPLRIGNDGHAVAPEAGGHRAVEGVHPELDAAQEVVDVTDSEQVARALGGVAVELVRRPLHHLVHLRLGLTERAADGDPAAARRGDGLRRLAPQVLVHPTLDDAVDELLLGARPVRVLRVPAQAALEPAVRALGGAGGVLAADVERRALVEDEGDVRAERRLDLHRRLGPEEALRAVEIGAEGDAPLLDGEHPPGPLPVGADPGGATLDLVGHRPVAHREDLEAARVGDDRPVPAHEAMQPAEVVDELVPGLRKEWNVLPRTISKPRRATSCGSSVLTVALVASGTKAGVRTVPWRGAGCPCGPVSPRPGHGPRSGARAHPRARTPWW
jgi:hypothetical protein